MLEVDEELDLSDLDSLDEMGKHLFCAYCCEGPGPAIARCGARAYAQGDYVMYPYPDKCPECVEEAPKPCPRCFA